MQSITVSNYAEDSCLKNRDHVLQGEDVEPSPLSEEKGGVKSPVEPIDEKDVEKHDSDSPNNGAVDNKDDFPEGGLKAWSVVLGSFCASFSVFGIINCSSVLYDWMQTHQLKNYSPSQISWIFGFELFATFFFGAPIGPIFDAYGPRWLLLLGSVLLTLSMMLLGSCTEYWHFFIVYSVLNGMGGGLVNTPAIASIGHYFLTKRGNATGIAMTSGGVGGVIYPLMLQKLLPKIGFAWSTRIVGFITLFLLIVANLLITSRLPKKKIASLSSVLPDLTVFKDKPFALLTFGIFLTEWGLFVPMTYIISEMVSHGHSLTFAYKILAVFNAGSILGRFAAGIVADMMGRLNTLIISIGFCVAMCLGLWLPSGTSSAMIIVFAITFGVASGSNLSLSPVCVGQMCKTENYGRYFSTCWMLVSFGTLTGLPIAGQILTTDGGQYYGLIIFSGLSYAGSMICLIIARIMVVGWKLTTVY
ncbi:major facilitator superfamily domain-containing protein [Xylogone sp. PMI_703]|nr:major facilitator superfamily domain-containing protein [Xylogone sp. PMI_703]